MIFFHILEHTSTSPSTILLRSDIPGYYTPPPDQLATTTMPAAPNTHPALWAPNSPIDLQIGTLSLNLG